MVSNSFHRSLTYARESNGYALTFPSWHGEVVTEWKASPIVKASHFCLLINLENSDIFLQILYTKADKVHFPWNLVQFTVSAHLLLPIFFHVLA